ncbi:MAG: serine hydrolase domain-containing protein [Acidimicrobiia bacterium]|nr:serine hydrolase domain-containing protein [Acidimicrobiia bacterium]
MAEIHGEVKDGFEGVRDAFARNFDEGNETGACYSVYHRGEKVVDLWGGVADPRTGRPYERDTLQLVFSTTKGATAVCAHLLAQRGELDFDEKVATYWPEFGAAGKGHIPVRWLLSHKAGLPYVDTKLSLDEVLAWDPMVEALAAQEPVWEPGEQHGYHATTYGWLVGEVIRRVTGKSVGAFFQEEVAGPLGLDFWIGLPPEQKDRVAPLEVLDLPRDDPGVAEMIDQFIGPDTMLGKALFAGGAFSDDEFATFNREDVHAAEIPAANAICDARSLARMYASLVGEVDGTRLLSPEQVEIATTKQTDGVDTVILGLDLQYGLGFMLPSTILVIGGGERSFGHYGAGGSVGFADPDAGLGVGYAMNKMFLGLTGDPRTTNLIRATYELRSGSDGPALPTSGRTPAKVPRCYGRARYEDLGPTRRPRTSRRGPRP